MKKSIKYAIAFIVILSIVLVVLVTLKDKSDDIKEDVVITQYIPGTTTELKKINIDSNDDKKELTKYIEKLKPLDENKMVNLALLKEIDIEYGNSIIVGVQLDEKHYCYYTNKKENVSSLSKLPKGLYEWLEEKIK